ncbi:hypothetical protein G7074_22660 [Pedobacter sp. HDW13]|uniref:hypothetical protein n=1 Tax=unclassified Pedobacter TaxID=2628915 RepID=UPI000F598490|nr:MULTISPECIES: hypothetical protein [unclassified Pedobacter]QIL41819.1 hypothetical protein G7074_22660 [Pedobacter sp. HDW13]RQO73401.1 hypothetical protein DBR40_13700 [Pedobacter sp. KBW01]
MEIQTHSVKTIGGYIGLQLSKGSVYHPGLIALNTGRNAFEYILKVRNYTMVYLPYYTCEVLLEPLHKLNIAYKFYHLDENLDPIIDFDIPTYSCLLYTNYYGLKTETVRRLTKEISNLIIDNAQAFFCKPIANADTFYSCRKFFGVPDGAYLNIATQINLNLNQDQSIDRFSHLIKSIDINIEEGYGDYIENNKGLCNNDIKTMSALTTNMLSGIDYEACAAIRRENFAFLAEHLADKNLLSLKLSASDVPMVYPFLNDNTTIKQTLIKQKIFVATYWPNVYDWASADSFEYFLAQNLIALPIDHRYGLDDMRILVNALKPLI